MSEARGSRPDVLSPEERASWEEHGFFVRPGFSGPDVTQAMLDDCVRITRAAGALPVHEGTLILGEANLRDRAPIDPLAAEEKASKIFRLHRRGVFHAFITRPEVRAIAEALLPGPIDCFLSQFIFKNPGAWGQPWHQDSFYFPFDRKPQVGLWLAITETTPQNGPLHVLPGSHREPVHAHVPDRRPNANYGYTEIVDHDMSGEVVVLMQPGDLLVFHSHLMHMSTDNVSESLRAAMVYHCAERGTKELSERPSPVMDWMPLTPEEGP